MAKEQYALRMRIRALGGSMTPRDGNRSGRPNSAHIWEVFNRGSRSVVNMFTPSNGGSRTNVTAEFSEGCADHDEEGGGRGALGHHASSFEQENRMSVVRESEREGVRTSEFNRGTYQYEYEEESSGEDRASGAGRASAGDRTSISSLQLNMAKLRESDARLSAASVSSQKYAHRI